MSTGKKLGCGVNVYGGEMEVEYYFRQKSLYDFSSLLLLRQNKHCCTNEWYLIVPTQVKKKLFKLKTKLKYMWLESTNKKSFSLYTHYTIPSIMWMELERLKWNKSEGEK